MSKKNEMIGKSESKPAVEAAGLPSVDTPAAVAEADPEVKPVKPKWYIRDVRGLNCGYQQSAETQGYVGTTMVLVNHNKKIMFDEGLYCSQITDTKLDAEVREEQAWLDAHACNKPGVNPQKHFRACTEEEVEQFEYFKKIPLPKSEWHQNLLDWLATRTLEGIQAARKARGYVR